MVDGGVLLDGESLGHAPERDIDLPVLTGAFASRRRGRLYLRRGDRYAVDFHLLTDALQVLVVARHRA